MQKPIRITRPSRRLFFKQSAVVAGAVFVPACLSHRVDAQQASPSDRAPHAVRLGMAGYTFNKFKIDQALEMLKKVDVHYLCIKDFHWPLDSTEEQIAAFHVRCKRSNVTGYGVGPIYMGS